MKTYEIEKRVTKLNHTTVFDVIINGRFTGTYLKEHEAYTKVVNSLNRYRDFTKEHQAKNVMFYSANNSHNSIA